MPTSRADGSQVPKVAICVPSGDGKIQLETMNSILANIMETPHAHTMMFSQTGCYVHQNREDMVRRAIDDFECDYIFFVDTDMIFEGATLSHLLSLDKDVVGVPYNRRKLPAESTVKLLGPNDTPVEGKVPSKLFKAYAVATGCMLIKREVFANLPHPWFFFAHAEDGTLTIGEDIWFCKRVREAGFDVWADPTVPIKHLGPYAY